MLPQIRTPRVSSSPRVARLPLLTPRSSRLDDRPKPGVTSETLLPKTPRQSAKLPAVRNLQSATIEIKKRQLLTEQRNSSTLNIGRELKSAPKPRLVSASAISASKAFVMVAKSEPVKSNLPDQGYARGKNEENASKTSPTTTATTTTTAKRKTPEQMLDEILRQEKFSFRRERVQQSATGAGDEKKDENPACATVPPKTDKNRSNCPPVDNKPVEPETCLNASAVEQNAHNRTSVTSLSWTGFESGPWPDGAKIPVEKISSRSSQREIEAKYVYKPAKKWVRLPTSQKEVRVPGRGILPLKKLPQDPLAKYVNEQKRFSMGFWSQPREESACTADDASLIHQSALFRLCEAFTENMGRDYLKAMTRESCQPVSSSDDETPRWRTSAKTIHDDNERIWNWDSSLPNSRRLREGKPPPEPETSEVCSLVRDSMDMKSDLSALFMIGSDGSTDVEFDEDDFVKAHKDHPFTDVRLIAGLQHPSLPRDRWLQRQRRKNRARQLATEEQISEIEPEQSVCPVSENPTEESPQTPSPPAPLLPNAGQEEKEQVQTATASSMETLPTRMQEPGLSTTTTGPASEIEESESEAVSEKDKKGRRTKTRPKTQSQRSGGKQEAKKPKTKVTVTKKIVMNSPHDEKEVLMWTYMTGFENACIGWEKQLIASAAPNPMFWIENLENASMKAVGSVASGEAERDQNLGKHGLSKRFAGVAGGLEQLRRYLVAFADAEEPKAEVLLDCMVKDYVLQMPLAMRDPEHLREVYLATLVKHPMLFKMVLRKRDILPEDLQVFVKEILELAEASDTMLSLRHPSESKARLITDAAKEMFTSGLLYGGPKCPPEMMRQVSAPKPRANQIGDSEMSEVEREQKQRAKSLRIRQLEEAEADAMAEESGGSNALSSYNADIANELAFYVSLRNPSQNILEEIAYKFADFGCYVRPLFEKRWEQISTEQEPVELLPELRALRDLRCKQLERLNYRWHHLSEEQQTYEGGRVQRLCKSLVLRLCRLLRGPGGTLPGSGAWMALLACLQAIMFWPLIGDLLVCKLNYWLPPLLLTLNNRYASVREEGCSVLAYLVCSYPFFSRLHQYSRRLLICNLTFALLDAMDCHLETYVFYHGVLGYLLHSIPCTAPIDCLLMWVPEIADRKDSLVARDWPLYVYYVAKYWPDFAMEWNLLYQRQVLALLQTGLERRIARRNAKAAILYLVRRTKRICPLLTAWRAKDDD